MLERISRFSWVLSAAYLLCGLVVFVLCRTVARVLSDLHPPMLLATRLFLWLAPWTWSVFVLSFSILLLARYIRLRPAWLNPGVTAALWTTLSGALIGITCMAAVVLYQPSVSSAAISQPHETRNGN